MGFLGNNRETSIIDAPKRAFRGIELRGLIFVTVALLFGLFLIYQAKTQRDLGAARNDDSENGPRRDHGDLDRDKPAN